MLLSLMEPSMQKISWFILLIIASASACAPQVGNQGQESGPYYSTKMSPEEAAKAMRMHSGEREISPEVQARLAEYDQRICCGVEAFDRKNPLKLYETMDYWSHVLRTSRVHREIKQIRTTTFKGHPILSLSDRNGDGKVDSFAYYPENSQRTVEFGFVFDLNEDGKIDYLVFNGGPMMTKDFEAVIWMNYHAIDSNGDGRIDIFVYNDIDRDGDRRPDRGVTAWLYDDNFDGKVDRAEYRGYSARFPVGGRFWFPPKGHPLQETIKPDNGVITISKVTRPIRYEIGKSGFAFQKIFDEINAELPTTN